MTSTIKDYMFTTDSETQDAASGSIVESVDNALAITTWLTKSVAEGIFSDPICGNGLCEAPQEFKAVNLDTNHTVGCAADCGTHTNDLTKVKITINSKFRSKAQNAAHTYNFCRSSEEVCWYPAYKPFTSQTSLEPNVTKTINILDGNWQVEIKDTTSSGLTYGSVAATLTMVNYSSPSNKTYEVLTPLTNWSQCLPGSAKNDPLTGTSTEMVAPSTFSFDVSMNVDTYNDGSYNHVSDSDLLSLKTNLASLYGVPVSLIFMLYTPGSRRTVSTIVFRVIKCMFLLMLPLTDSVLIADSNLVV